MALCSQHCTYFFSPQLMKELLVEGVNKESNASIHLCKLVKLEKLGNAVDVKHILENTFLFLLTIVVFFFT